MNLSVSVTVDKIAESSALIVATAAPSIVAGLIDDVFVVETVCDNVGVVIINAASADSSGVGAVANVVGVVVIAASIAEVGVVNIATFVVG